MKLDVQKEMGKVPKKRKEGMPMNTNMSDLLSAYKQAKRYYAERTVRSYIMDRTMLSLLPPLKDYSFTKEDISILADEYMLIDAAINESMEQQKQKMLFERFIKLRCLTC